MFVSSTLEIVFLGAVPLPAAVMGSFFDSESTRQLTGGFLIKYFQLFDSDRKSLVHAYAPNASFSFSFNSLLSVVADVKPSSPSKSDSPMFPKEFDHSLIRSLAASIGGNSSSIPNTASVNLLKSYDRNMVTAKDSLQRHQRLFQTPSTIISILSTMFSTRHDAPESFLIDSWLMPGVDLANHNILSPPSNRTTIPSCPPQLIVSVHGSFEDGKRLQFCPHFCPKSLQNHSTVRSLLHFNPIFSWLTSSSNGLASDNHQRLLFDPTWTDLRHSVCCVIWDYLAQIIDLMLFRGIFLFLFHFPPFLISNLHSPIEVVFPVLFVNSFVSFNYWLSCRLKFEFTLNQRRRLVLKAGKNRIGGKIKELSIWRHTAQLPHHVPIITQSSTLNAPSHLNSPPSSPRSII